MCRGLTLIHPAPRRPAAYGVSSDLTTTPSCPRATASAKNSEASAEQDVTSRGMSSAGGTARASSACRVSSGKSIRSTPSRCSTSNKNTDSGGPSALAARDAVSWNGIGRPSARSAISSPSNTAARTGSWPRTATTSGIRPVISSSVRVNNRTPPEARCAWIRIPSSFHSTAACTPAPTRESASEMLEALAASIGRTGRPTSSPNAASAALPPASAAAATAPSEPRSIIARRTSATGTDAARATASVITPSSAPCRSSPESNPTRKRCSSAVARPNSSPTSALRAAAEPFPLTAPIAENPASTSLSESAGTAAAGNPARRAAQPTPICRCGSSPDRYATAIGTSAGPASRSAPASRSIFASRALVAPTACDTSAISASSMNPFWPRSAG